jgi:hypothetical protein
MQGWTSLPSLQEEEYLLFIYSSHFAYDKTLMCAESDVCFIMNFNILLLPVLLVCMIVGWKC